MQKKEHNKVVGDPFRVYRPYSIVVGNKAPSITEKNPRYQIHHGKKIDYKVWKDFYFEEYEVDLTRKIISEVLDGVYVDITIGDILRVADDYKYLSECIVAIIMKASYTGRDYREDLRKLIIYNLQYKNSPLYKDLVHV